MKVLSTLFTLLSGAAAIPLAARQSTPFDGTGTVNVITQSKQRVGCLNAAMAFTTSNSQCATFTFVQTTVPNPPYGDQTTITSVTTSAGACGDPFKTGSQYQEGGNRILLCGEGSDAGNSYWGTSGGFDGLIGLELLEADNDDIIGFVTVGGGVPTGDAGLVLQQQLGAGPGPRYSLTWSAN